VLDDGLVELLVKVLGQVMVGELAAVKGQLGLGLEVELGYVSALKLAEQLAKGLVELLVNALVQT